MSDEPQRATQLPEGSFSVTRPPDRDEYHIHIDTTLVDLDYRESETSLDIKVMPRVLVDQQTKGESGIVKESTG